MSQNHDSSPDSAEPDSEIIEPDKSGTRSQRERLGDDGPKVIDAETVDDSPGTGTRWAVPIAALVGGLAGAAASAGLLVFGGGTNPFGQGDTIAQIEERVQGAEQQTEAAVTFAQNETQALRQQISALSKKLDALAEQSSAGEVAALGQALADFEGRLAELEKQDRGAEARAALETRLQTVEGDVNRLAAQILRLSETQPPADLNERVVALQSAHETLDLAVKGLAPAVSDLDTRLEDLTRKVEQPDSAAQAALGIAVARLAQAMESGRPFGAELDTVASFLPDDPAIETLRDSAASGVATAGDLKGRFADLAAQALRAEMREGREGFWNRLIGNALAIVTVRRTGAVAGEETDAVLARMEQAVQTGDFSAALSESAALSDPARAALQPWLEAAQARVEADALIDTLSSRVLASVAAAQE